MHKPLLILCVLWSCRGDDFTKIPGEKARMSGADAVINKFEAHGFDKKEPAWHLTSDEAYVFHEQGLTHVFSVDIEYYKNGRKSTHVFGDKAVLNKNEKILTLDGNVKVISSNGRRLYTEHLVWNDTTKILQTPPDQKKVRVKLVHRDGSVMFGDGLKANQQLEGLEIKNPRGSMKPQ